MFVSGSQMAACITWKAVGDLPVLYCRMQAGGRPAFLCSGLLFILAYFDCPVVECPSWP